MGVEFKYECHLGNETYNISKIHGSYKGILGNACINLKQITLIKI